jgi:hypothetical protein
MYQFSPLYPWDMASQDQIWYNTLIMSNKST